MFLNEGSFDAGIFEMLNVLVTDISSQAKPNSLAAGSSQLSPVFYNCISFSMSILSKLYSM